MKIILWDWDNTLANTIEPLMQAYNLTLKDYNHKPITREEMKAYMNFAGRQLFLDLFPDKNFDEVRSVYLKHYIKNTDKIVLMKGAEQALKWTKDNGFTNILASNKHYQVLFQEVKNTFLEKYFDGIFGAEQFSENKPSKVFTDESLKKFQNIKQLFVVGDGVSDIKMARNYPNAMAILVGTDPDSKEFEKYGPDFSITDLTELPKLLIQHAS